MIEQGSKEWAALAVLVFTPEQANRLYLDSVWDERLYRAYLRANGKGE